MAEVRATPLPLVGSNLRPVMDRAVAQHTGYQAVAPQVPRNMEMDSLLQGLSNFNGSLKQYTQESVAKESERQAKLAQQQAAADAARAETGVNMDELVSGPVPNNVPLAHGELYRDTLGQLLADREAVRMRSDLSTEYEQASKDPEFNAKAWLAEKRGSVLDTIKNPNIAGRLGQKFTDFEAAVLQADEKKQVAKLTETENQALHTRLEENFRADMTPESVAQEFDVFKQIGKQMGRGNKEMTSMLLTRLAYLSEQKGGDPALFGIFDRVDPTTKQTLLSLGGPELAAQVTTARDRAKAQQFKTQEKDTQKENLLNSEALNKMLENEPERITRSLVEDYMGDHSVFPNYQAASAFLHQAQKKAAELRGSAELDAAFTNGTLGRYPSAEQKATLERHLGPSITAAWQAAASGDVSKAEQLGGLLLGMQSQSRSTENVAAIERLIGSTISSAPNPDGPDGAFKAAATLYRALSADPKYRDTYFKDDASTLFRRYTNAVARGSDPVAAYKEAYQSISSEAKATAEKFSKTPEFADMTKKAHKEVTGSSWWPRLLGGNGRVNNQQYVDAEAASAVRDYYTTNPNASPSDLKDYMQGWTAKNFIMEPESGNAVKVPQALANETTREALGEYSKRLKAIYGFDGEWQVEYRPAGSEGLVHVVLRDGGATKNIGTLPIQAIRDSYVGEKTFDSPQDRALMQALPAQVRAGKVDPALIEQNRDRIERLGRLGGIPKDVMSAIDKVQLESVQKNLQTVPKLSLGQPTTENIQHVPTRSVKVDNALTASIAKRAATSPAFGSGYQGLAASLITMGEAVVLKASNDPNPDAGKNIGMGYNLKANTKNVQSDLRRAGVAEDKIDMVINGQAQLTPGQAEKLLMVTMPRYEKLAIDAAEKTAPGLWQRMPSHQKAVMIDIAWQVGDPAQFRKAWSAAASGDAEGFRDAAKVFYKNAAGERVEDKRRGELRANMLAGSGAWMAVVDKYGRFPSNAIEAVSLNKVK